MSRAIQEIDLHGKNTYQAKLAIEAALRRSWGLYKIRLIHGHNHGTRLVDFIWEEYAGDPRILSLEKRSPGVTDLNLREL